MHLRVYSKNWDFTFKYRSLIEMKIEIFRRAHWNYLNQLFFAVLLTSQTAPMNRWK